MKTYVVYDSAAEAYGIPFFIRSKGEALRGFAQAAKDPQSQISKHPADFTLFEIGEYNEFKGEISLYQAKVNLGTAVEYTGSQA